MDDTTYAYKITTTCDTIPVEEGEITEQELLTRLALTREWRAPKQVLALACSPTAHGCALRIRYTDTWYCLRVYDLPVQSFLTRAYTERYIREQARVLASIAREGGCCGDSA